VQTAQHWVKGPSYKDWKVRNIKHLVYDNEKENWRTLTNKEIYAMVNKPTITETIWLNA
jgi:hypothetical protein